MPMRCSRGFSMAEVVVTITIIFLLLAVSVPVFLMQRGVAHDATVRSNLRVTATVAKAALAEHGTYPAAAEMRTYLAGSEPEFHYIAGLPANRRNPNRIHIESAPTVFTACARSMSGFAFCIADRDGVEVKGWGSGPGAALCWVSAHASNCPEDDGGPGWAPEGTPEADAGPGANPGGGEPGSQEPPAGGGGPAGVAPVNVRAPELNGGRAVGDLVTATAGGWDNHERVERRWERCDQQGDACVTLSGASDVTYTATGDDVGRTVRYVEVAQNAFGSTTAFALSMPIIAAVNHFDALRAEGNPSAVCRMDDTGGSAHIPFTCRGAAGQLATNFTLGAPGALRHSTNSAVRFDGGTHYSYAVPSSGATLTNSNHWSAEVWGLYEPGGQGGVFSADDQWGLAFAGTEAFLTMRVGNPWSTVTVTSSGLGTEANRWYHLVGVYDAGTLRLYVNGELVGSRSGVGVGQSGAGNLHPGFGSPWWMPGDYLKGKVDEFAFYKHSLTAAQVRDHYRASIGTFSP